jgi:hypothetical protein
VAYKRFEDFNSKEERLAADIPTEPYDTLYKGQTVTIYPPDEDGKPGGAVVEYTDGDRTAHDTVDQAKREVDRVMVYKGLVEGDTYDFPRKARK